MTASSPTIGANVSIVREAGARNSVRCTLARQKGFYPRSSLTSAISPSGSKPEIVQSASPSVFAS